MKPLYVIGLVIFVAALAIHLIFFWGRRNYGPASFVDVGAGLSGAVLMFAGRRTKPK